MSPVVTKRYAVRAPKKGWTEIEADAPMKAAQVLSHELDLEEGKKLVVKDAAGRRRTYIVGNDPRVLIPRGLLDR